MALPGYEIRHGPKESWSDYDFTAVAAVETLEEVGDYLRGREPPDGHIWFLYDLVYGRPTDPEVLRWALAIPAIRRAALFYAMHARWDEARELTDLINEPSRLDYELEMIIPKEKSDVQKSVESGPGV